jgi:hypothetical protein
MFSQCQEFELYVQTELITLSKQAYEKILDIQKTPDLQERVNFLKVMIIPHHFQHFHHKCQIFTNLKLSVYDINHLFKK